MYLYVMKMIHTVYYHELPKIVYTISNIEILNVSQKVQF